MRHALAALLIVFLHGSPGDQPGSTRPGQPPLLLAIRNVNVISVAEGAVLRGTTVVITDDRITAIGPAADLVLPAGASVLDGTGKFLVPGFIDLHTHLSKTRGSALGLFVANGVTTVRDMGGDHQELLVWRREVMAGQRVGPRFLMAGPYLESASNIERMRKDSPEARVEPFDRIRIGIATPDEARQVVARLAAQEVDFLKFRTFESPEVYVALNEAANAHRLPLAGHVNALSPAQVLTAGQDSIDHTFFTSTSKLPAEQRLSLWRGFRDRAVPIVPTLVTLFEATYPSPGQLQALAADDEGRLDPRRGYLSRFLARDWREQAGEASVERTAALRKIWEDVVKRDLREMHESGMDLLIGSDVAVINIYPGFSLHDEMALFVRELGMTPAEVLDRATRRSARFLGIGDSVGSIERGRIADLVLLDADPLADIANTRRIHAVVLRGRVFGREAIDRLKEEVKRAPDRTRDDWGRTARR